MSKRRDIMEIWDEVIPYRDDPRIQISHREFIKGNLGTFYYATRNIYLHNHIKHLVRTYLKVQKKKGNKLTYDEVLVKIVTMLLDHEYMHKILFETVGIEEAFRYDLLTQSKEMKGLTASDSIVQKLFNGQKDILP